MHNKPLPEIPLKKHAGVEMSSNVLFNVVQDHSKRLSGRSSIPSTTRRGVLNHPDRRAWFLLPPFGGFSPLAGAGGGLPDRSGSAEEARALVAPRCADGAVGGFLPGSSLLVFAWRDPALSPYLRSVKSASTAVTEPIGKGPGRARLDEVATQPFPKERS